MRNFYEIIKDGLYFNKFELDDSVCVEYKCPLEDDYMGICSQTDYVVHVLSGKKTWKTLEDEWVLEAGQTLFIKKGATLIRQFFENDFCMLGFFVSDDLIREAVTELVDRPIKDHKRTFQFTGEELFSNNFLDSYFQSMLMFFRGKEKPSNSLLKLKFKELIGHVIHNNENPLLASYFKSVATSSIPSIPNIMETNFCYNLTMKEFAKLSHRSLSTFKRDFQNHYNTSPGRWLLNKRLERARKLIVTDSLTISQVAFECGFEDVSHFSRSFKEKFGITPSKYEEVSTTP